MKSGETTYVEPRALVLSPTDLAERYRDRQKPVEITAAFGPPSSIGVMLAA